MVGTRDIRCYALNETVFPWPWLLATAEDAPTPDAHGVLRSPPLLPEAHRLRCQPTQGAPPREAEDRQTVPDKQVSSVPRNTRVQKPRPKFDDTAGEILLTAR